MKPKHVWLVAQLKKESFGDRSTLQLAWSLNEGVVHALENSERHSLKGGRVDEVFVVPLSLCCAAYGVREEDL